MELHRYSWLLLAAVAWCGISTATEIDYVSRIQITSETSRVFGEVVDSDGDTIVVGNPTYGQVYIYVRRNNEWELQVKLPQDEINADGDYGASVAIHGDTVVVGAPEARGDRGSVYVYQRDGELWSEAIQIDAPDRSLFGASVDVDDDTIVVGAFAAAYASIYTRTDDSWVFRAKLERESVYEGPDFELPGFFGYNVALQEGALAISSPTARITDFVNSGAVYIYEGSGSSWGDPTILVGNPEEENNSLLFGHSLDMEGNQIVVGAIGADGDTGAVYVIDKIGEVWTKVARLTAADSVAGDLFGWDVTISGPRILAGTRNHAHVADELSYGNGFYAFELADGVWQETAEETFGVPCESPCSLLGQFGHDVHLDGRYAYAMGDRGFDLDLGLIGPAINEYVLPVSPAASRMAALENKTCCTIYPQAIRFPSPDEDSTVDILDLNDAQLLEAHKYFNDSWRPVSLDRIVEITYLDGVSNTLSAIAVLATNTVNGQHKVQVRDLQLGQTIGSNVTFFNAGFEVFDIAIIDDTDGDGDTEDATAAVLGRKTSTGRNLVEVRNLSDGSLIGRYAVFNPGWEVKSLAIAYVAGAPVVGVLGTELSTGRSAVDVRLVSDGLKLGRTFFFGPDIESADLAAYPDIDGPGPTEDWAWLVLGKKYAGANIVRARRVDTKAKIKDVSIISGNWKAIGLTVIPEDNLIGSTGDPNSINGFDELGVLAIDPDFELIYKVRDFDTGDTIENLFPCGDEPCFP